MCWAGNINKDRLLQLVYEEKTHNKIPYKKHTIHKWGKKKCGVIVNDNLVLIGDRVKGIKQVLDTIDGAGANFTQSSVMGEWKQIPKHAFLKIATGNMSDIVGGAGPSAILKHSRMALFVAMEKDHNLSLKLKLFAKNKEVAQNISEIIKGFLALGKIKIEEGSSPEYQKLARLANSIKFVTNKNEINLDLKVPVDDFMFILHTLGID